jgi:hypothetical protein
MSLLKNAIAKQMSQNFSEKKKRNEVNSEYSLWLQNFNFQSWNELKLGNNLRLGIGLENNFFSD